MPHVVTERCIGCKHTNCVAVCPVNCFREGPNFLVIDPGICIDCALCVRECPVDAIYEEADLPERWLEYVELNARCARQWPKITRQIEPLSTAGEFREVMSKRHLLLLPDTGD